jgi:hypothetical protein
MVGSQFKSTVSDTESGIQPLLRPRDQVWSGTFGVDTNRLLMYLEFCMSGVVVQLG